MNPKLRADADLYRIKDGCWWGVYHEYRGDKASPPVKKLTDWLGAPKIELHRLRLEKKAELAEELGLKEARQFNLESMTNQYLTFKEKEGVKRSYLIYIKRSLRFLLDACGNFDLRNWNQVKEEVFLDFLKD